MRLRQVAVTATATWAVVAASMAISVALTGPPELGARLSLGTNRVVAVSPTGLAWAAGVRPGQEILELRSADQEGGWQLTTSGADGPIVIAGMEAEAALHSSLIVAIAALAAAVLGAVYVRANRPWSLPLACLGMDLAAIPFVIAHHEMAGLVLGIAAAIPLGWLVWRARGRPALSVGVAAAGLAILAAWWLSWSAGAETLDGLQVARAGVATGGLGLLVADRVHQRDGTMQGPLTWRFAARWLAVLVAIVAVVAVVLRVAPSPLVAVLPVIGVIALPMLWARVGPPLEAALMADIRELTAADVAEEERAAIAREIHDVSLQGLSASIRRLELVPEARGEVDNLRAIADELRAVAVELRPPMLDDLGLGATLDYLVDQADSPGIRARGSIEDTTVVSRSSRPPPGVELAVYRMAQEAIANAIRHSGGSRIDVTARISATSVELEISDNGRGFQPERRHQAAAQGRMGLVSMHRRAQAIGAQLVVSSHPDGTRIRVTWAR